MQQSANPAPRWWVMTRGGSWMRGGLLSPPQLLSKWMAWQGKGLPLLHPSDFSGGNRKSINQCSLAWGRETTVKCPHEPKAQSKWTYCDQYVSRRGETISSKKSQHNGSLQPACAEYSRAQSSTEASKAFHCYPPSLYEASIRDPRLQQSFSKEVWHSYFKWKAAHKAACSSSVCSLWFPNVYTLTGVCHFGMRLCGDELAASFSAAWEDAEACHNSAWRSEMSMGPAARGHAAAAPVGTSWRSPVNPELSRWRQPCRQKCARWP